MDLSLQVYNALPQENGCVELNSRTVVETYYSTFQYVQYVRGSYSVNGLLPNYDSVK